MKLIKNLGRRKSKKGKSDSQWAIFQCPICKNLVEKVHHHGKSALTCGCLLNKHGYRGGKNRDAGGLYAVWRTMKCRCNNPKHISYKYYGLRGIKVCKAWQNNFITFKNWALSNNYQKGLYIDRIDNYKGYKPSNCRWVTCLESNRNKRINQ